MALSSTKTWNVMKNKVHLQIHYQTHHQFILQDAMHQVSLIQDHRLELHHLSWFISRLGLHDVVRLLFVEDSSSPSAGTSRKRCRSPTTLVPSSTPVSRSIAPALADLPPRKRFRDSYSSEASGEEHMEIGRDHDDTRRRLRRLESLVERRFGFRR
ncbi:hypothetical protein Tco_1389858 [Tanacetum coccineum]